MGNIVHRTYSCALVGPHKVGRHTYLRTLQAGLQTVTTLNHHIHFDPIVVDEQKVDVQCALICLEASTLIDPSIALAWMLKLREQCGFIPYIVCGMKADLLTSDQRQAVEVAMSSFVFKYFKVVYCEVSSDNKLNVTLPWHLLAKKLAVF